MQLTKAKFEKLYFEHTNKELAKKLNVSEVTINNYARKFGLSKGKGYCRKLIIK